MAYNKKIATYRFVYAGGRVQVKTLVTDECYEKDIKPSLLAAHRARVGKREDISIRIESRIKKEYGDWFITRSPIYKSIKSGVLELGPGQGNHPVVVELIKSYV